MLYNKMMMFFSGLEADDNLRPQFTKWLMEDDEKRERACRFIAYIDRVESEKKINFIVNLARCACMGYIDLGMFFRLVHIVTHTMEEDLIYLRENIDADKFKYDQNVQGLINNGVMYCSDFSDGR